MTNVEGRVIQLELALRAALARLDAAETRLAAAEQLGRSTQGITYNWGGGGGGDQGFWCKSPADGLPPSSGPFPDITPSAASLTVYQSLGGILEPVGIRSCKWWYRDALPGNRLVPLVQTIGGASYDMIANSCTPVDT